MSEINLDRAKEAHDEIGKAIQSLAFAPPEMFGSHQSRAASAMNNLAVALGLVSGPDAPK